MIRLVVDASVAVKWLVEEEESETAERLLRGNFDLHAPRLLVSEVANAIWRRARAGEIGRGEAGMLVHAISEMPLYWHNDEELGPDAVRLALAFDRPAYDCVYLALAHRIGAQVVTTDARFANALAATEHGGSVKLLGDLALA